MSVVAVTKGDSPVLLAMPHTGTELPPEIAAQLNATGRALADTDWHVDRLYDGLLPGATIVRATFHRYVIDANRDPSGASLYPGQNTTGLVPLTAFDGKPLWMDDPNDKEIEARRSLQCFRQSDLRHVILSDRGHRGEPTGNQEQCGSDLLAHLYASTGSSDGTLRRLPNRAVRASSSTYTTGTRNSVSSVENDSPPTIA